MAVEPGNGPSPGIAPVAALLEAVALPGIDHQLAGAAALHEGSMEFLRLTNRRAAVERTMQDQCRRRRPIQPDNGRTIERDVAEPGFAQRPAGNKGAEIVVAGIVAAEIVRD